MKNDQPEQLEAAFAESNTKVGGFILRPFSTGTLNLCRQLNLTMFTTEDANLSTQEQQDQIITLLWMQSQPLDQVLAAVREGRTKDAVLAFSFGVNLADLPGVMREVNRISAQAQAALVEVLPKPSEIDKDEPGN